MKVYRFPAGIFEIDEQLLVPERTTIAGAADPNDMERPTESPDWQRQTLFLATRGASNYSMNYCHAKDMVTTRVGFVLSSHCTITNVRCPPSPPLRRISAAPSLTASPSVPHGGRPAPRR